MKICNRSNLTKANNYLPTPRDNIRSGYVIIRNNESLIDLLTPWREK